MRHVIYDGESFYELDEECLRNKEEAERKKETSWQREPGRQRENGVKNEKECF